MPCERCPCPETCLARPVFCQWAAEDPPDEVKLRHIRVRSAMGAVPVPVPATSPVEDRPDVDEAWRLARAMNACPFRSRGPGCGCSGANCALRHGAIVSHRDCFDCLERYG